MKPITKKSDKIVKLAPNEVEGMPHGKTAFTIMELLTVMSIIVILIGLLVPSLNMVKRYAKEVKQRAQFHSIDSALELFNGEWGSYPPSDAQDQEFVEYCGAMKLCEAMLGQDLMGFHPRSRFLEDGTSDGIADYLYATVGPDPDADNLRARRIYLQQTTDAYRLWHLYSNAGGVFSGENGDNLYVLCDVYNRVKNTQTGKGIGMPILYYRADTMGTIHDPCGSTLPTVGDNEGYIYNYTDNAKLVELGLPPSGTSTDHPLSDPQKFYEVTKDNRIIIKDGRPYRPDSYILISAGFDGTYGTDDDIFNF